MDKIIEPGAGAYGKKYCRYCGSELLEYDLNGNHGWNCANDCDFEVYCKEHANDFKNDLSDIAEQVLENAPPISTHCWNCKTVFYRLLSNKDEPYGNYCPNCGESLRNYKN